jgi:hypothetical protein
MPLVVLRVYPDAISRLDTYNPAPPITSAADCPVS